MEFNEKLQNMRKKKGLTQEELAEILFVSRTAISKWESGRGYPAIDSLKAIANFFGVTVDELLSKDELLTVAEESGKKQELSFKKRIFGLLDLSAVMLFFLPFFRQFQNASLNVVSLLQLNNISLYLKIGFFVLVLSIIFCGLLTLIINDELLLFWDKYKTKLSLFLTSLTALLFILALQPYAASLLFIFLIIKVLFIISIH